jgi:hypothetical protein
MRQRPKPALKQSIRIRFEDARCRFRPAGLRLVLVHELRRWLGMSLPLPRPRSCRRKRRSPSCSIRSAGALRWRFCGIDRWGWRGW